MIKVGVQGVLGFAIQPNLKKGIRSEMIKAFPRKSKVVFIDLAPTKDVVSLIEEMEAADHRLAGYFDHHLDLVREAEINNVNWIKVRHAPIKIVSRREAPSACHLINVAELKKLKADVCLFHCDPDGYFGLLKGCGMTYPAMMADVDILDGGARGVPSKIGSLFASGLNFLGPSYYINPEGYEMAKAGLFRTFERLLRKGFIGNEAEEFVNAVDAASELARKNALDAARATDLIDGGVALADFRPIVGSGGNIAISYWRRLVYNKYGDVLLCSISYGHFGQQVYVSVPRSMQDKVDLRNYLPRGVDGRVPFRVQVPTDLWSDFLAQWRARLPTTARTV